MPVSILLLIEKCQKKTIKYDKDSSFEDVLVPTSAINCRGYSEEKLKEITHSIETGLHDFDLEIVEHEKDILSIKKEYLEGEINLLLSFIEDFFKYKDSITEQEYVDKLENFIDRAEDCNISNELIERCYQYHRKIKKES